MTLKQQSDLFLWIDEFLNRTFSPYGHESFHDKVFLSRMVMKMELTNYLIDNENATDAKLKFLGECLFESLFKQNGFLELWSCDHLVIQKSDQLDPFSIRVHNLNYYLVHNGFETDQQRKERLKEQLTFWYKQISVFFPKVPTSTPALFKHVYDRVQKEHYFIENSDLEKIWHWLLNGWKNSQGIFSTNPSILRERFLVKGSRPFIIKHPCMYEITNNNTGH